MKRDKYWRRKKPQLNWWGRGVKPADLEALTKAEEKRQRIAARNLEIERKNSE